MRSCCGSSAAAISTNLGHPPNLAGNRPEFAAFDLVRPVQFRRGMDSAPRLHQEVTDRIIRVFWDVVNELGTGYLEKIYVRAMVIALRQAGFEVVENYKAAVHFRGEGIGHYVFDLVVNGCILLELKATGAFESAHAAQALGYLRSSTLEVALILNFGQNPSIRRVSMTNDRKRLRQFPAKI
jgi:GxxExxY protein